MSTKLQLATTCIREHAAKHPGMFALLARGLLYTSLLTLIMWGVDRWFQGSQLITAGMFSVVFMSTELICTANRKDARFIWLCVCVIGILLASVGLVVQVHAFSGQCH
jgi:hypothetical protein